MIEEHAILTFTDDNSNNSNNTSTTDLIRSFYGDQVLFQPLLIYTLWLSSYYEDSFVSVSESKTMFGKFKRNLLVQTFASGLTDEKLLQYSVSGNIF